MPAVDLEVATADTLARMLRRLPASLWNTAPDDSTLQRDLYHAFASQVAIWLEQREIARTMTLLLEAQGVDLDTLLQDYGLRRYLGRPDPYARQVAMNILWTPKGTLYAVERLADLLFDLPHSTLRTGQSHQHIFVAATHPITTPYSYWGLVSSEGLWYALTVDKSVPSLTRQSPPGLDVSPGPHTLTWFTVYDGTTPLYVSIHEDTLRLEATPPSGHGTTEPFAVLDGTGNRWLLRADDGVLETVLDTGLVGFGTWRIRSQTGTLSYLSIDRHVPTLTTSSPSGSTDQTPGGSPLDWFTVEDAQGTPWYVSVETGTLAVTSTPPGGAGTATLAEMLDANGQRWVLTARSGVLVATPENPSNADLIVTAPDAPFQAFQLVDSDGVLWWICLDEGTLFVTPRFPVGASDVTPPGGPYHWWRMYDADRTPWYVWPSTSGVLIYDTVSPGGLGTLEPQQLGDAHGVLWHGGIRAGSLIVSAAPSLDYTGLATAICLTDEAGGRWFWRVHKQVLEWSSVLWPNTIDQSPWGNLGWLQVATITGEPRYIFPTTRGDGMAADVPPLHAPWGWKDPLTLLDAHGIPWSFTVTGAATIGLEPGRPDDLPVSPDALPLAEALEAFSHVQAAGSLLTLLVS